VSKDSILQQYLQYVAGVAATGDAAKQFFTTHAALKPGALTVVHARLPAVSWL